MNLFTKQRLTDIENKLMIIKGERGEGINLKFGINMYTLLYIKQINNKHPGYSTRKSTQYSLITYVEKNLKKNGYVYMYI